MQVSSRSKLRFALATVVFVAPAVHWLLFAEFEYRGLPASHWLTQLKSPELAEREDAFRALKEIGTRDRRVVPALLDRLDDSTMTKDYLCSLGGRVVSPLRKKLRTGPHLFKLNALGLLQCLGVKTPGVLETVEELLADSSYDISAYAAGALGQFGKQASSTLPALLKWAAEGHVENRAACLVAMARVTDDPDRVRPILLGALHDKEPRIWVAAVNGLTALGEPPAGVEARLKELSEEGPYDVQADARWALEGWRAASQGK
ncbi:MAG: hypothetical protein HY814_09965 [Candidatus Riflebacteria bacterium]|nr:hypothetical protein [Candidatus Riflebacteria bacterium]